jgi:hypothetical protein
VRPQSIEETTAPSEALTTRKKRWRREGRGVDGMAGEVGGEAAMRLDREPKEINVRHFSGVTYGKEIISN